MQSVGRGNVVYALHDEGQRARVAGLTRRLPRFDPAVNSRPVFDYLHAVTFFGDAPVGGRPPARPARDGDGLSSLASWRAVPGVLPRACSWLKDAARLRYGTFESSPKHAPIGSRT